MSGNSGDPAASGLTGGYRHFQGPIDTGLRKRDPDASIPWGGAAPPPWALNFKPRIIADIGSAQGVFTAAVLTRLGQWGCLERLERIVLVEEEPEFGITDGGDRRSIVARCAEAIRPYGIVTAKIELENAAAAPSPPGAKDPPALLVDGKPLAADLILASHVTYYFDDGGRRFLSAAAATVEQNKGLVWVITRKLDCPIYRARYSCDWERSLAHSTIDFAEPLEAALRAEGRLQILDEQDQWYLGPASRPHNCPEIAQLLGWRLLDVDPNSLIARTAAALCKEPEALFAERHMIIR
jgi:hypothetical protein